MIRAATEETYLSLMGYINQSLGLYGYPGPINMQDVSVGDKVRIVNALYQLLSDRQVRVILLTPSYASLVN